MAGAYLLHGPQGVGRGLGAAGFASALLCAQPSALEPCGRCKSCGWNAAGTHPDLVGISVATAPGAAWYVNVSHAAGSPLGVERVREILGPVLADPAVPKTAHHAKFDLLVLDQAGLPVRGMAYDTMIASYLLDPERSHKLDNLVAQEGAMSAKVGGIITYDPNGDAAQLTIDANNVPIDERG